MDVHSMLEQLAALVYQFFHDPRVLTLVGLIVVDVLLGIAAAIRLGKFEWAKLGNFYKTMVLPYLIGYLAFYVGSKIIVAEWLGPQAFLVSEATITVAWLTLVGSLAQSIISNAKELGYPIGDA